MKTINILICSFAIILFSMTIVNGTPPLPTPPQTKVEADKLILEAKDSIEETEKLLSKAQNLNLKSENIFDRIFVKRMIWKMKNKINNTKLDITTVENAYLNENFGIISAATLSSKNKSSYIKGNLEKIIEGKRIKDWSRVDIIEVRTTSEQN